MASEKQIQTYRKAQKLLEDALKKDLQALWDKTSSLSPADTSVFLQEAIPLLVDKYGVMVATVAVNWFEQLTGEKGFVPSSYRREAWEISTRWALSKLGEENTSRQEIFNRLVGSTLRHVRQHGRDTIDASVREHKDIFYARKIVGETCDFCLILASRGPVYGSEKSAGGEGNKYHDNCDCLPIPVKGKWVPNSGSPMGVSWVGEDPSYDFMRLYVKEYRPFWRKNDTIQDVTRRRARAHAENRILGKPGRLKSSKNKPKPITRGAGGGGKTPNIPSVEGITPPPWLNEDALDKVVKGRIWMDMRGVGTLKGGHEAGRGWIGKTEFPETWSRQDIRRAIILTWSNPDVQQTLGDAVVCRKEIDGVVVHVHVWGKELSNFNAAYPICGEGVYKNTIAGRIKVPMKADWREEW